MRRALTYLGSSSRTAFSGALAPLSCCSTAATAHRMGSSKLHPRWRLGVALSLVGVLGVEEPSPDRPSRQETEAQQDIDALAVECSELRDESPSHPGLVHVVADSFEEVVFEEGKVVLLKLYRNHCPFCSLLAPIIEQVAQALKDVDCVTVAEYNLDRNHKHGLLTYEEWRSTPRLWLYPPGSKEFKKQNRIERKRDINAEAIIRSLHELTNENNRFNLEAALAAASALESSTEQTLRALVKSQVDEVMESRMKGKEFGNAITRLENEDDPCSGPLFEMVLQRMRVDKRKEQLERAMDELTKCRDQSKKFWEEIHKFAEEKLLVFQPIEDQEDSSSQAADSPSVT